MINLSLLNSEELDFESMGKIDGGFLLSPFYFSSGSLYSIGRAINDFARGFYDAL